MRPRLPGVIDKAPDYLAPPLSWLAPPIAQPYWCRTPGHLTSAHAQRIFSRLSLFSNPYCPSAPHPRKFLWHLSVIASSRMPSWLLPSLITAFFCVHSTFHSTSYVDRGLYYTGAYYITDVCLLTGPSAQIHCGQLREGHGLWIYVPSAPSPAIRRCSVNACERKGIGAGGAGRGNNKVLNSHFSFIISTVMRPLPGICAQICKNTKISSAALL